MVLLFWMVLAAICISETIEYEIKERDNDKYLLYFATLSNFIFLFFPNEVSPVALFVVMFVNLISSFPFYILQKLSKMYVVGKIVTYGSFLLWCALK